MKKNITILGMIVVLLVGVCYAGSFVDDTSTEFDLGVYNWTAWKISDVLLSGELPDAGVNSAVDTTGLVGLWHLNGDWQDTSGNNNDGTASGATFTTSSKLGSHAGSFDGSDDSVNVGSNIVLDDIPVKTIEFWTKLNTQTGNGVGSHFLNKGSSPGWFIATDPSNNRNIFGQGFSTTHGRWSFPQFSLNEWHHIVVVYDRQSTTNNPFIYIDGISQTVIEYSTPGGSVNTDNIDNLLISADPIYDRSVNGIIDEVSIWNRSLSPDEILAHYNAQKDNYPSSGDYESKVFDAGSTVAWDNINWAEDVPYGEELPDNGAVETVSGGANMTGNVLLMHMDDASGTIVDSSGSGNNGTQSGGVTYGAAGKLDNALSFDGVNDYIYVGNEASFDFERTDAFTTSVWIKAEATPGKYFSVMGKLDYVLGNKGWRILSEYNTGTGVVFLITDNHGVDDVNLLLDPVFDNQWHHVVFTYDGNGVTGGMKGYLDGILKASGGGGSLSSSTLNNVLLKIGGNDQYGVYGNGLIDEAAIFNRALSADEILDHYKRGALRLNVSAKSCDDSDCDGETMWEKICTSSPCDISTLSNSQYMQYKIDMQSDSSSTSEVSSVSIVYGAAVTPFTVGGIELIYRTPMEITENSGSSLTDYQVLLTVDTASLISAGKMQSDCDDIRFTDSDETTELPYWIESDCNTANTQVWVKVPSLAASSTRTIYMYYGNDSASSASNGTATFEFFDDFDGVSLDPKWTTEGQGTISTTSSYAYASSYGTGSSWHGPTATADLASGLNDYVWETYFYWSDNGGGLGSIGSKLLDNGSSMIELVQVSDSHADCVESHIYASDSSGSLYSECTDKYADCVTPGWHTWTEKRFGSNLKVYLDSTEKYDGTTVTTVVDKAHLYIRCYSTYACMDLRIGRILVRKYASSEPTYTIGSEQQDAADSCTDNDGDGWGVADSNLTLCNYTASYDCNDSDADINPNAYDIPNNGIDEDCSGDDASASYEAKVYFTGETGFSGLGYYIGDDVYYEVNFMKNNMSSDEDVVNIVVNLTDVWGNVIKSQPISDMEHPNTGNWTGIFTTHDIINQDDDKVNLKVYVYNSGGTLLDWRTHGDEWFVTGTIPSFISTAYTYLTDALSNHTVKDLIVNSSEAKIDWSESTLDLHVRNIDLDSALTISDRSAYLSSAAYSELNDSATITFYNVNCASPFVFYSETATTRVNILLENKQCLPPRCTAIQCTGSTLTVTVSSFTGYAAQGNANLTIDADDPKFAGAEVHFTADYRNVTDDIFISGATCTIYFTDGNYAMAEGANIYTYNRTFVTEGLKDYNVTCNKAGFSTLTAFDNATIVSVEIPEFSAITLGLGLIAVLAGLIVMRKKR